MTKPNNPNISIPAGFAAEGQKADFTEEKIANGFDPIDPDVLAGDNLNKFIDDTYKGLNYATEGVSDLYKGAVLYDYNETYSEKSIVFHIENGKVKLYHSLIPINKGNSLANNNFWEEINIDTNVSNFVLKNGDTMTGILKFNVGSEDKRTQYIITDYELGGTAPNTPIYTGFQTLDSNGIEFANIGGALTNSGAAQCSMWVYNGNGHSSIQITRSPDGTTTTQAPVPAATNSTTTTHIATTGWVNDPSLSTNVVHRSGTESISGAKTFTGTTKAPTPAAGSNDTTVATTAWVRSSTSKMPNYSSGVSVTLPTSSAKYTAPNNGIYVTTIKLNNKKVTLYINNVASSYVYEDDVTGANSISFTIPLSKGDVIYWNESATSISSKFYPFK